MSETQGRAAHTWFRGWAQALLGDPTAGYRLVRDGYEHAVRLGIPHPADGHWMEFTSPYPPDLAGALDTLRAES